MKKSEKIALNTYLSGYDSNFSYDEIIKALFENNDTFINDNIMVWEAFENHPKEVVATFIESLKDEIKFEFKE